MVASQLSSTRTTECANRAMESRDDNSLLQAIVDRHDRDAFDELCKRHQVRAFNFALSILNDSALAHDAVQETMLSIWLSRKRIPQSMDAVAWMLSMVTTKSSHIRRSQKRRTKREMRFEMERSRSNVDVAEEFEGNELIAVLRECIDELPDVERTVLACSYCTSMSQQEIAEVVGISQQTVSNKIQRAIERLRLDLTKAGVAAVVPLLSRGTVFEAMTTGHACPPGIMEGIALRIESYEKAARTLSRRAVANTGRSAWLISAAVVIAIGAVLGVTWFRQPNQIATIAPPPEKATVVPSPAPTHVPFSRTWNFNTRDQADDFKVLEGSWHHISDGGPAGEGCMESDGDFFVASPVPLVVSSAKLPIRITYRERVVLPGTSTGWMSTFAWSDSDYRWKANFHNLGKINSVDPTGPAWNEIRTYISDSFMASWTNGELQLFSAFELKGNSRLGLAMCMLGRHRIYDLTIQEIAAAEIPDVRSYLAALEKIEPSKRVGRVIVPELQSNHPQDPVFIGFDDLTKVPETRTSRP